MCISTAVAAKARLPIPEFSIDLDAAPEERFTEVVEYFKEPILKLYNHFHLEQPLLKLFALEVAFRRGPENPELQAEIRNVAKITGVSVAEVQAMQWFEEVATLMVPIVNLTGFTPGMEVAALVELLAQSSLEARLFPSFGCTGIIATDDRDGIVYQGRNLDFSFASYLQPLAYTGIFRRSGVEIFRAQTMAGYSPILTGMRKGPNGFTIAINTRYADHVGGYREMLSNLFNGKREVSGWTKRKIIEVHDNYESAVEALSNTPYVTSEYNIVSGVGKGVILARNADGLAYKLPLHESSKKYIIMTNFDYVWNDVKEIFDPTTVEGIFHPRRKAAEQILDSRWGQAPVPELLFEVLNDKRVMAKDTIFQVIMSVETGLWNASLPACVQCRGRTDSALLV